MLSLGKFKLQKLSLQPGWSTFPSASSSSPTSLLSSQQSHQHTNLQSSGFMWSNITLILRSHCSPNLQSRKVPEGERIISAARNCVILYCTLGLGFLVSTTLILIDWNLLFWMQIGFVPCSLSNVLEPYTFSIVNGLAGIREKRCVLVCQTSSQVPIHSTSSWFISVGEPSKLSSHQPFSFPRCLYPPHWLPERRNEENALKVLFKSQAWSCPVVKTEKGNTKGALIFQLSHGPFTTWRGGDCLKSLWK